MLCIKIDSKNPFFCLAAEEYLLKQFTDDIFMLWQSEDTVVVGKHQNAMGEINPRYVYDNNIKVARRISGGGTVFHDSGNLNFAYIQNVNSPSEISFRRFLEPIVEAMGSLGVEAVPSGRNDLLVDGKKVSGNAQHIFKNRVLHHGTLLFNANLKVLGQAIKVVPGKYMSKAVQSKRSEVTNILPYLNKIQTTDEFGSFLMQYHAGKSGSSMYTLNVTDQEIIHNLEHEKFETWEWNFGYSPKYNFRNRVRMNGKELQTELQVEKGIISGAAVSGDYFSMNECEKLKSLLPDTRHSPLEVSNRLREIINDVTDDHVFSFF